MIGELIAPFLPTTCYMTPLDALGHSKTTLKKVIPAEVSALCPQLIAARYAKLLAENINGANRFDLPGVYPYDANAIDAMSAAQVVKFLDLCTYILEDADDQRLGLSLLTNFIVAVCKQGTISSDFQEKIRSAVKVDLGKDVKITPEIVSSAWGAYGQYINEMNVQKLMKHLLANIVGEAVRLTITVQQSQYHALTAFCTIGRAMLKFPNFTWHAFERIAPGELEGYKSALEAVGNRAYYGFKKDLGSVQSARFRSLAYFSKELLVKLNGETNLNANRVFKAKVSRSELIDKVVAQYVKEVLATEETDVLGTPTAPKTLVCNQLIGIVDTVKKLVVGKADLFSD